MKSRCLSLSLTMLIVLLAACGDAGHDHGSHGHSHAAPDGPPTVSVTRWTIRTELFMEYPTLVAGRESSAAVHLTELADFSPVAGGELTVTLTKTDGHHLEFRGESTKPGVFVVHLQPDVKGNYAMILRVEAPDLHDEHDLGHVTVYGPDVRLPGARDAGEAISFLKEQQWALDFGTVSARQRSIRPAIAVPATVQPRPAGEALLTAPVPGRIDPGVGVPVPGSRVRAGAVLARIVPHSDGLSDAAGLRAALVEAEQENLLAAQERDRAARLVEARALPERRLDEARALAAATEARLRAARERWGRFESLSQATAGNGAAGTFALRAPFDGIVSEVRFHAGVSVGADEPLMRLIDADRLHVIGAVPERFARALVDVNEAELTLGGHAPLALGKPVAVNPVIDPQARTAQIRFALDNREVRLPVGQAATLRLFVGDEAAALAIPEEAVVDDDGHPVVFVQMGGELFERRPVQLGDAADGYVQVRAGVAAGERVVHRGAYLIRLASMATEAPAHGHVH
jgi:RND family efflux transporter MFP subunit